MNTTDKLAAALRRITAAHIPFCEGKRDAATMNELHEAINDARHEALAEYDAQRQAPAEAVAGEHTPEPWSVGGPSGRAVVVGQSRVSPGALICRADTPENARRIVACVNACAGIGTAQLEAGAVAELVELARKVTRRTDAGHFTADARDLAALADALNSYPEG